MRTIKEIINEEKKKKVTLTDVDKIYCHYIISGIQREKDKMKALDDLSAMLSTKAHLGDSDQYTTQEILTAYLDECPEVPELFGDEGATALYNYMMDVKL